ncbi:DNA translocase FtsK [candidate division KSB3 bacterium]|uniref:DNA translocase FtsK n=1 Tax=candidate division KSB3 bacterium TaxID=2044937 RepID=A0A9D5Q4R6_9BACT|nr:DNA translocase FtsK [candidate division KSB3 bacterium]MBD3323835.1 DNA translocase FtsK [candidate division KSB3 bacterium]
MAKQGKKGNASQTKKRRSLKKSEGLGKSTQPSNGNNADPRQTRHTRHEIQGILYFALTLLLLVSLTTYHAEDLVVPSGQETIHNVAGIIGAIVADFLFRFFGYMAYMFPLITLLIAIDKFLVPRRFVNYGNVIAIFLSILSLCALLSLAVHGAGTRFSPGGFVGVTVAEFLISYLNLFGGIVVILTGIITAGLLLRKYLFRHIALPSISKDLILEDTTTERVPQILETQEKPPAPERKKSPSSSNLTTKLANSWRKKSAKKKKPSKTGKQPGEPAPQADYQLPSPTLLNKPQSEKMQAGIKQNLLNNSKILQDKLLDFGIEGQVVGVLPGPVITRYEFQPAPGVKVSRIVSLADDLALGMKAVSIRIVAPVPGKDVVGIEVPNAKREFVYLRDLIESPNFVNHPSRLVLAIGKDIGGRPYFADLSKMPHLLIAGATGSGKSVCLNSLICSILFHTTPEEVRFIMVDPKMLELGVYDNIPHLLIPVVKDPQQAYNALRWATEEMTRRYGILAQKGVRNIAQYNEAILDFQQHQHPDASQPKEDILPYIVIIVDELADLMMVSSGVEKPITRLAQMARAVGIHLILATQRPSVDVITGVIKANFPARISFRVSSKVDSRTILDANGAELLLGDGDMLFLLPGTSRIRRLHGCLVTEKEIKRLTSALKKTRKPQYDSTVMYYNPDSDGETEDDEVLYRKAAYLVVTNGEASISLLRRSLKIGHSRASRLIDMMQREGIVGEFKGSRPRKILMTEEQLDNHFRTTQ